MKFYSNITLFFVIWLAAVIFISYFGFLYLPRTHYSHSDYLSNFANWDGGHFLNIAQIGYNSKIEYAFFPLYPMLINLTNKLINNFLVTGIFISLISFFLGLHLLYTLLIKDFGKKVATKAVLALIFFPTSFYFLTVYSEGLFFLLAVAAFYFLQSKKLFYTAIAASLASATRPEGIAVVLAVIIHVYFAQGLQKKNWVILLSPLGLIAYGVFLYYQVSNPVYFITAESSWQRNLSFPWVSFWSALQKIAAPGLMAFYFNSVLDLLFAIFGVGLVIRGFRFVPVSYSIYACASIVLPLVTATLLSMPRFLLVIFPMFILMGMVKNQFVILAYQIISVMLLSLFVVLYINGYWVS